MPLARVTLVSMARSKNGLTAMIIVVAVLALLYILNPSSDDFAAWQSRQTIGKSASPDSGDLIGALSKGAGELAGAISKAGASLLSSRKNYYFCSTYSYLGGSYLGVATFFVKLK